MSKRCSTLLIALLASAGISISHAATEKDGSGAGKPAAASSGQTGSEGGSGGRESSVRQFDCDPASARGSVGPHGAPGPIGRSGTATAAADESGTMGSTGSTRATSTSGATGTTGETGGYDESDPSGSVTTSGATDASAPASMECDPPASTGNSGGGATGRGTDATGTAGSKPERRPGNTAK